jgi:hypothetical protein
MLSDTLHEIRQELLRQIAHYSKHPFDPAYPGAQRANLVRALFHLDLARHAFDNPTPDDQEKTNAVKLELMGQAINNFDEALSE